MNGANNGSGAQVSPASAVSLLRVRLGVICYFTSINIDGEVIKHQDGYFELTKDQLDQVVQDHKDRNLIVGKAEQ